MTKESPKIHSTWLTLRQPANFKPFFEASTGLHVATGYTRIVIGGRGPYIEFLPTS